MISKDVQGEISFVLWLFIIVGYHFSFCSTKKLQAVTFTRTYTQVVIGKQFFQGFVKFYI
jgi:hypothetical protein